MNYSKQQFVFTGAEIRWVVQGWSLMGIDVSGAFSGAFAIEASNNGTTWTRLKRLTEGPDSEALLQVPGTGHYAWNVTAFAMARVVPIDGFNGEAILCALTENPASVAALSVANTALAAAARAHRTVGSLVAPSSTRIPLANAATSLIASRYTLEFVEGDADDAGWLQYMYAALSFSNNLPADEFYVKYLLGDSALVQVYPTREDAQESTNIIATAVVDGDAISSASALLLTDSSARWGWIYGTGANPDVDGTIWKATRVSAPPHLIDLPSGGDPTGRRYVLSVDIVVTNESGSAKNLSIGLTGGNTQFSTLVPFPIPNETVSGRFVAEIEFALANYQTATSVRQAITVRRATLGGVDIAPGGFSTYGNWNKSHYHGLALGAIATLVSGASASLRSAKITLEPEV